MLGPKFVKFLMPTLKWRVNSSSNFASFLIVMTDDSSVNFKLILFQLWSKGSHQNPNFETFKCSGENLPYSSCHFPNHKSFFLQILHHSSVSWKITPLYIFSLKIIYFAQKEHIKVKILETFKCLGQNSSNPYVNFETTSQFLFKFCITLQSHERTPLYFFRWNIKYFAQ